MNILDKANLKVKSEYPFFQDVSNFCTVHESETLLQINFESKGCKNSYNGKCIMCDYGKGRNISKEEMLHGLDFAIKNIKGNPTVLLVNTYGSILDEFEFSKDNLITLLTKINKLNFSTIIFETHYKTITKEKIDLIKKYVENKSIYFEIGIESFNDKYRRKCLNKEIDNNELFETIKLVKENGFHISANLLIGVPFLDTYEQLNDSIESINIAFENNVDEITLFPINIKQYTLLYELYKNDLYKPISSWMLIEILNNVKEEYLHRISFAWYGNRDMSYSNNTTIFPVTCDKCKDELNNFFDEFNNFNIDNKKELLDNINKLSDRCECKSKFLKELENRRVKNFDDNIKEIYKIIEKVIIY